MVCVRKEGAHMQPAPEVSMQTDIQRKRHARVSLAAQGETGREIHIRPPRILIFPSAGCVKPSLAPQYVHYRLSWRFFPPLIPIHGKYHFTQIKQAIFTGTILICSDCNWIITACWASLDHFHTSRTLFRAAEPPGPLQR